MHGMDLSEKTGADRARDVASAERLGQRAGRTNHDVDFVTVGRESTGDIPNMRLRAAELVSAGDHKHHAHLALLARAGLASQRAISRHTSSYCAATALS